jgi:phosphopantothenate synthetase
MVKLVDTLDLNPVNNCVRAGWLTLAEVFFRLIPKLVEEVTKFTHILVIIYFKEVGD